MNRAAHCADPEARGVVSREAGVPWASLWLYLSPPSPFIIRPPVTHTVTHGLGAEGATGKKEGREEEGWVVAEACVCLCVKSSGWGGTRRGCCSVIFCTSGEDRQG